MKNKIFRLIIFIIPILLCCFIKINLDAYHTANYQVSVKTASFSDDNFLPVINDVGGSVTILEDTSKYGNTNELNANPAEGYKFSFYLYNNYLVSTQKRHIFRVTKNDEFLAFFRPINQRQVVVLGANNYLLGTFFLEEADELTDSHLEPFVSKVPTRPGYQFERWNVELPLHNKDDLIIIKAQYKTEIIEEFNIYVVDENEEMLFSEVATYGKTITLTALDIEGKNFSCWKINDEIINTSNTHTLSVYFDMVITAVYEDQITVDATTYLHPQTISQNSLVYFLVQSHLSPESKVIEQGIIYYLDNNIIDYEIDLNTVNVHRVQAIRVSPNNEFAVMINTLDFNNLFVRSYLILQDENSQISIIYSTQNSYQYKFKIFYELDGGTNPSENKSLYSIYDPIQFKDPIRDGYIFEGWYYTSDFNDEGISSTEGLAEDIILYAKWKEISFELTYELDGGVLAYPPTTYTASNLPLVLPIPEKDGYEFLGWYENSDFTGTKFTEISKGVMGNKKFYAKFALQQYSITYHANGGKYITTEEDIKTEFLTDYYNFLGQPGGNLSTFMHGAGKTSGFKGIWYTLNSDGKPVLQKLYQSNNKNADASLDFFINQPQYNAKWLGLFDLFVVLVKETNPEQNFWNSPYTGGIRIVEWCTGERYKGDARFLDLDIISSQLITSYDINTSCDLIVPKRDGYVFAGWYKNDQFIGRGITKINKDHNGNLNLYAKWLRPGEQNNEVIPKLTINNQGQLVLNQEIDLIVDCSPNINNVVYKFSSSNINIIEVDSAGKVKAKGLGTAIITVKLALDESYSCTITITVYPEANDIEFEAPDTLHFGDQVDLKATVYPLVTYQGVIWSVSDEGIAQVSSEGKLTCLGEGDVIVRAQSVINPSLIATVYIKIIDGRDIIVDKTEITIMQHQSTIINSTLIGEPNSTITYTSENQDIATVNQNGKVVGVDAGSTKIIVSLLDNPYLTKEVIVTVQGAPAIIVTPSTANVTVNKTITLSATVKYMSNSDVTWSTSNNGVATVTNQGVVTGIKPGTATITVTSVQDSSIKAIATITVIDDKVLNITSTEGTTIEEGYNLAQIEIRDSSGNPISRLESTFTSSNPNVVTVSQYGTISAHSVGTATITVKHGDRVGTITLTIVKSTTPVTLEVTADPGPTLFVGDKGYQLFIKDSRGNDISRLDCKFSSSNASIATVSSYGTISGLSAGSAVVTVTYNGMKATITLTIKGRPEITLSPASPSITVGKTQTITATVKHLTNKSVTWKSSNTSIATISSSGVVTAKAVGSAVITATSVEDPKVQATITVKVVAQAPVENKRNTIIEIALGEKGYREGSNNNTKYGKWYGMNYQPWCAMFVSWCANQAGISTSIIPKYASVYLGLEWFKAKGSARYKTYAQTQKGEYVPQCGDIVFFKSNGASHTGLVIRVEGNTMYTIEGNTSDQVLLRYYYYKSTNTITGYGVPAYPASSTPIKKFSVAGATYGGGSRTT